MERDLEPGRVTVPSRDLMGATVRVLVASSTKAMDRLVVAVLGKNLISMAMSRWARVETTLFCDDDGVRVKAVAVLHEAESRIAPRARASEVLMVKEAGDVGECVIDYRSLGGGLLKVHGSRGLSDDDV